MISRLKLESLITGAKEETILNSRSEVNQFLTGNNKSNATEKMFIFDKIIERLMRFKSLKEHFTCLEEAVVFALEDLIRDDAFARIYVRVVLHFYTDKTESPTEESFRLGVVELLNDCLIYIENT